MLLRYIDTQSFTELVIVDSNVLNVFDSCDLNASIFVVVVVYTVSRFCSNIPLMPDAIAPQFTLSISVRSAANVVNKFVSASSHDSPSLVIAVVNAFCAVVENPISVGNNHPAKS